MFLVFNCFLLVLFCFHIGLSVRRPADPASQSVGRSAPTQVVRRSVSRSVDGLSAPLPKPLCFLYAFFLTVQALARKNLMPARGVASKPESCPNSSEEHCVCKRGRGAGGGGGGLPPKPPKPCKGLPRRTCCHRKQLLQNPNLVHTHHTRIVFDNGT